MKPNIHGYVYQVSKFSRSPQFSSSENYAYDLILQLINQAQTPSSLGPEFRAAIVLFQTRGYRLFQGPTRDMFRHQTPTLHPARAIHAAWIRLPRNVRRRACSFGDLWSLLPKRSREGSFIPLQKLKDSEP